jgi:hypothetical protein
VNPIFFGKALNDIALVLPHAFDEVGSDACVDGSISSAGQEVDTWLALHIHFHSFVVLSHPWIPACAGMTMDPFKPSLDSGLRRNDDGSIQTIPGFRPVPE